MKVKVFECESFEDFLNAMHGSIDKVLAAIESGDSMEPKANNNNPTKATSVTTEESPKKKGKTKIPTTLDFYVKALRKKHGLSRDHMIYLLKQLWKINKTSVYNILAKQVAITIDKMNYEDHISNSKTAFIINLYDGEVYECKAFINNLELIPVFRTKEDAELARTILKPLLDEMF